MCDPANRKKTYCIQKYYYNHYYVSFTCQYMPPTRELSRGKVDLLFKFLNNREQEDAPKQSPLEYLHYISLFLLSFFSLSIDTL